MEGTWMKRILILGTGCPKCSKLYETVMEAASQLKMACDIRKVTDIREIMKHGVAMTPALVVDGEVKVSGRVPSIKQLKELLT
jgi:small redox-active disulfide protein 2